MYLTDIGMPAVHMAEIPPGIVGRNEDMIEGHRRQGLTGGVACPRVPLRASLEPPTSSRLALRIDCCDSCPRTSTIRIVSVSNLGGGPACVR